MAVLEIVLAWVLRQVPGLPVLDAGWLTPFTRNPMTLGAALFYLGIAFWMGSAAALVLVLLVFTALLTYIYRGGRPVNLLASLTFLYSFAMSPRFIAMHYTEPFLSLQTHPSIELVLPKV